MSDLKFRPDSRMRHVLPVALAATLLFGCSPEINHRGYYPKAGALAQVSEGMAKTEVEGILGSPSTTASVNFQGDSYYYITSVTQGRAFLDPVEIKREVIAVRFDQQDQVTSVAQYGLEDGRIVNINDRTTPVAGSEFNILNEIFKRPGVTNYGKGGGTIKDRL
jgi:outer membrane protein assembly factor BamE (lipoprotein component of BamABCDE complex)